MICSSLSMAKDNMYFCSRKKQALDGITLYPGNSSSWYGDDSNGLVSSWPCWEPQAHPQTYPKWCVQSHPANIRFPYNGPQNKIVLLKLSEGPNNDLNATYHNHAPLGLNMLGKCRDAALPTDRTYQETFLLPKATFSHQLPRKDGKIRQVIIYSTLW